MVFEFYDICVQGQNDRQTDNPNFYKVETYPDRLLVLELYIIPNFVKIVRAVIEILSIYMYLHTYIYPILAHFIISGE